MSDFNLNDLTNQLTESLKSKYGMESVFLVYVPSKPIKALSEFNKNKPNCVAIIINEPYSDIDSDIDPINNFNEVEHLFMAYESEQDSIEAKEILKVYLQ